MKNDHIKLQHRQKEEVIEQQAEGVRQEGVEFPTAEAALRCDAAQVEVPPEVETRLAESIRKEQADEPQRATPWWKRLFL